jgi:PAS domain S-box-containing protein
MPEQAQTPLTELELIVNRSPAVAFLWRAAENWPVEFVSDNIQQFGYTPEDFTTQRVLYAAIIHPDDLDRVATEVAQYSSEKGRTEFVQEYRVITKTGEVRWIDDRTWIRRDASGTITHYQGIVLDITERKRAEEEAQRRAAQAALVYEVGQRMSGKLEMETLLPEIVTAIRDAFDYYSVLLMLVDRDAQRLTRHAFAGDDADLWPRDLSLAIGEGMMGQAAATGKIQLCGDVSTNPYYVKRAMETTKSELVVPIKCRQQVIGVLDLQCDELDAFDETDVMLMGTLADQVATAIENASLYEETQQRLQGEAMLFQASQRLASAPLRVEEVAEIAVYQLGRLLRTTECSFSLPHPTTEGVLQVLADFWVNEDGTEQWADGQESFNLSDYPATARVMETLKPLVVQINDPDADTAELTYTRPYTANWSSADKPRKLCGKARTCSRALFTRRRWAWRSRTSKTCTTSRSIRRSVRCWAIRERSFWRKQPSISHTLMTWTWEYRRPIRSRPATMTPSRLRNGICTRTARSSGPFWVPLQYGTRRANHATL